MNPEVNLAPRDRVDLKDRAWLILLGAALCMLCSQPAAILFTFGIFSPAIAADTGWSAVAIAGAIGPSAMVGALVAPLVGRAADRIGVRRLVIIGGPAYGVGLAIAGYAPNSALQFMISLGIACALGFAAIPIIYAQLASGWFAKRRGLALSLIFTATSIGVGLWSLYASALLPVVGWRNTYAIFGLTAGTIILAAGVLLIRNPPDMAGKRAGAVLPGLSVGEAMRTMTFWKIALVFVLITGILSGSTVTLPTVLRGMGIEPNVADKAILAVGMGMLVGRLSAGILLDKLFAPTVTSAYVACTVVGMTLMLVAPSATIFFIAAAVLGMGIGAEMDAAAYMVSRAFGLRAFGAIYGLVTLGYGVSGALGTASTGAALAGGVPPATIFASGAVVLAVVILLLTTIRRRHFPYDVKG